MRMRPVSFFWGAFVQNREIGRKSKEKQVKAKKSYIFHGGLVDKNAYKHYNDSQKHCCGISGKPRRRAAREEPIGAPLTGIAP